MNIKSPDGQEYLVGELVGQTATYRLRLCTQVGTGRSCLLQIAIEAAHNGVLDRMAYILRELRIKADELEVDYESHRKFAEERLNYHFGFPQVVATFLLEEQGNRRVNILDFPALEEVRKDVRDLVPLHNIVYKDHQRVNLRTSAWIMGKILKLLAFAHDQGVALGNVDLTTILIQPDEHFVILFDWSQARMHPEGVPTDQTRKEVMEAARALITLVGGDRATRTFPVDDVPGFEPYTQHLLGMAAGSQASALTAHGLFYQLLKRIGWKGFHPFTSFPR